MLASPTLLAAHEGKHGPFIEWLKKLGLGDFIERYPLPRLVEWGWVVPQYRVVFPERLFEYWNEQPPSFEPQKPPPDLEPYDTLWSHSWYIDNETEPLWFLDPMLHPDNPAGQILRQNPYLGTASPLPTPIQDARGFPIIPYADYFYRWQGYALVDTIRSADNIAPVFSTPDAVEYAMRIAEWIKARPLTASMPKRWPELATLMTGISHFDKFLDALSLKYHGRDFDSRRMTSCKGAESLANYFGLTSDTLAKAIKDQLLVLAEDWLDSNKRLDRRAIWTMHAWPHLQADIQLAIHWLTLLTGKTFEDYVAEWKKPFMGWGHSNLDEALPYGFIQQQKKFSHLVPYYLKSYNETKNICKTYDEATVAAFASRLHRTNYPFGGFIAAFFELHEHLSHRPPDWSGLDLRELQPLDHFALLAIHAEGCLRRELDSLEELDSIPNDEQGLTAYIKRLAGVRNISQATMDIFNANLRLAGLKKDRANPIGRIQEIRTNQSSTDEQLAKAFLGCLLARNYFAHHDFLDHELLHTEQAGFLLCGILLTVLVLLDSNHS